MLRSMGWMRARLQGLVMDSVMDSVMGWTPGRLVQPC
jgi:hypothetical protein